MSDPLKGSTDPFRRLLAAIEDALKKEAGGDPAVRAAVAAQEVAIQIYGGTAHQVRELLKTAQAVAHGYGSRSNLRADLGSLLIPGTLPELDEGDVRVYRRDASNDRLVEVGDVALHGLAALVEVLQVQSAAFARAFDREVPPTPIFESFVATLHERAVLRTPEEDAAFDADLARVHAEQDERFAADLALRLYCAPDHKPSDFPEDLRQIISAALRERREGRPGDEEAPAADTDVDASDLPDAGTPPRVENLRTLSQHEERQIEKAGADVQLPVEGETR